MSSCSKTLWHNETKASDIVLMLHDNETKASDIALMLHDYIKYDINMTLVVDGCCRK